MKRYSPQRETILKIILDDGTHLSVDDIYNQARSKMPKISLGTVYRNLKTLEEHAEITQVQGPQQVAYFEPNRGPHHHFICRGCNSIRDIKDPEIKVCTGCISKKTPLKIEEVITTLYGTCEACS
ncbi:transcriptional repressor [Candidatus Peregrinibacteria bacterium]|jgi:Fur family transcriptional regulator, peroxide stress response regulator|nr:transcriptional repressor [Candidatus Peregrinibacteria bacterium]MBT4631358.1 transcriptional repressor [Candidatus Peregrinibacteria bacterium]MBT5517185.1 transcriptional repressor [Candidatus Peregrinibacteria bacterium]MBT5823767.1 transcriptional repressor [Candidatus Peregrinibacteria bacterium]